MSKQHLQVVGKTTDDRPVVAGVFRLYDEQGLPFDTVFSALLSRGVQPSWLDLYVEAERAGWSHSKIVSSIDSGLRDAGYPEQADRCRDVFAQVQYS